MENESERGLELNPFDILYWMFKYKWIVIILTITVTAIGFLYTIKKHQSVYEATASMVISIKNSQSTNGIVMNHPTSNDIYLAQDLVETYAIILKSNKVIEYIINDLNLDIPITTIKSYLDLKPEKETQVMLLTVTCNDAQLALDIANSLLEIAPKAMMESVELGTVNVLDKAMLSTEQPNNKSKEITAISACIGFFMGSFIALLLGFSLKKIKDSKDVQDNLLLKTIGEVPRAKRLDRRKTLLMSDEYTDGFFIESILFLTTVFQYQTIAKNAKKILVTSSLQAEGKTTIAINLSMALANSGKSVVLIDCDFRKPSIYKVLNISRRRPIDITDVIIGKEELDKSIIKIESNLSIIPCFGINKNYSILVSSPNLVSIINELEKNYDYVIIDSPPAYAISDTMIISNIVDCILLIIRQDQATLSIISDTVKNLRIAGAEIIGCVLNDIRHFNINTMYKQKYKNYYKNKYKRLDAFEDLISEQIENESFTQPENT